MVSRSTEKLRLAAVERLGLLDTPPEERFERLTRIARQYYQVKSALFTILDEERQWFKSRQGIDFQETCRSQAFCDYAIRQDKVFVVEDATEDPRFRNNPLVTGDPHIRFYAGQPIREPSGFKIGNLCIIDDKPRKIEEVDLDILRTLGTIIEDELERAAHSEDAAEYFHLSHLNRSIQRAQNIFLTSDNERAAFEQLLSDLLALTGSEFGLIGEILHKPAGEPYLKVGAITNIAWNPETQALYQSVERRGMVFDNPDNLLGTAIQSDDVVISDDLINDSRSGGAPPGHPKINCFMAIPVFSADRKIGLVGLANRAGGYRKVMAEELAPLLQTVGNLIERKQLYQEKREHQKRLEQAANYDSLTGLPNRRRLTELFEQELYEADQRQGTVTVCFIDLDGFKEINDEHGHAVGDAVLKSIAQRLESAVRSHDLVARLGGDEFVAILRDVDDPRVYGRLLEVVRHPISYQHFVLQLSGSMGVAVYPDHDADADLLLRHADQAMYAAKESGKNRYKVFDVESHLNRKERVRVLEQIESALAHNQLELFYQPRINLQQRQVEGFEALIRWRHPEEGLLSPAHFLVHIEYTEHARRLGLFVLNTAIREIKRFVCNGLPFRVSVNLSPSHFLSDQFRSDMREILGPCNNEVRSRLILEVLETTALDDIDMVVENLAFCRQQGVEIALDDFGTGYSSLNHFRKLDVQEIKIDRSFVSDMLDGEDGMIVEAILNLSHSFRRRTVAEGIEDPEVEARLIELGCGSAQGYLYSKPVPLADALAWAEQFTWGHHHTGLPQA
ncbi:EAL domain-containing protein [Marinobacter salinexigens]|uniref:EAL domain-containing protein n=1 Tax=Marinobacter salinexigens TaxID=2919747 RepID=A0A5B0VJ55_9GAMM|nr:EAL domain-containing protein [Marinobacter salinexigens]KAA1174165.1 EAL domain-containing protein [Marinobacter salinexigens]